MVLSLAACANAPEVAQPVATPTEAPAIETPAPTPEPTPDPTPAPTPDPTPESTPEPKDPTLADAIEAFRDTGYEVEEDSHQFISMIGASSGVYFKMSKDVWVSIYEFDDDAAFDDAIAFFEDTDVLIVINGMLILETVPGNMEAVGIFESITG